MIFTETARREIMEMQQANLARIRELGIHPLCKMCLWECKVANAKGLTMFGCADFREK